MTLYPLGLALGGPIDGQMIRPHNGNPILKVEDLRGVPSPDELSPQQRMADVRIPIFTYRYLAATNKHSYWIPKTVLDADSMGYVVEQLQMGHTANRRGKRLAEAARPLLYELKAALTTLGLTLAPVKELAE